MEPTLRDLAYQAANATKLNSFAGAYDRDPDKAKRLAATFAKTYPAVKRVATICDANLVNQVAFITKSPGFDPMLVVMSCPFPTAMGEEAVFAGTLGDSMDIICPVAVRMKDIKGFCVTIAASNAVPTLLDMAVSTTDPVGEEGPAPAEEGAATEPPGPDRLGLDITDPTNPPCIVAYPKMFLLSGGYKLPEGMPINVTTTESIRDLPGVTNLNELHSWYESMRYGITNLDNYSIQAKDVLFTYAQIDSVQFTPETNLATHFTVTPTYLTPNDPVYHEVTANARAAKDKAMITFGSKLPPPVGHTTPTQHPAANLVTDSPTNMQDVIKGFAQAINESGTKSMTSTEREQAKDADDTKAFYQLLFASVTTNVDAEGNVTSRKLQMATVNPIFNQVLRANKNTKATKLLQNAIEAVSAEMNYRDTRFASASNLKPAMFDQPLTAAIRTGTWEYEHTVLHPEGILSRFGIHHLAPPRTWSADYKTRLEGEIQVIQQEQVDEASSRTAAKSTELYHLGRLNTLHEINEMIANFYTAMHTFVKIEEGKPPAIWNEIAEFDKIMRSSEGRQWFEHHHKLKELHFNVAQDIQSTIAGFVKVARRQEYKNAIMAGEPIADTIFANAQKQALQLRSNMQSIILTMGAGPYKEASFVFKIFQPPDNKRKATPEANSESPNTRNRTTPPASETNTPVTPTARIQRNGTTPTRNPAELLNNTPQPQGKTILKQLATDATAKLLHPGLIFPHPIKANSFTLMCCRSAYDGKTCTFQNCKFFHFPSNLNQVPADIKTKLTTWVASQPNVTWNDVGAAWATPPGN